jgi:hypothetical protein
VRRGAAGHRSDTLRGRWRELEGARNEGCVGYRAGRREGGPPFEILARGSVAAVYGVRLSVRVMRVRRLRGRTWVGPHRGGGPTNAKRPKQ